MLTHSYARQGSKANSLTKKTKAGTHYFSNSTDMPSSLSTRIYMIFYILAIYNLTDLHEQAHAHATNDNYFWGALYTKVIKMPAHLRLHTILLTGTL